MNPITVQDLQAIAVDCTSQFFNNGVPLSDSLCKVASDRGLNPEQLKRAVEATNTLTYLKSVEVSPDRTQEFPLADYTQILKQACLPSDMSQPPGTFQLDAKEDLTKSASVEPVDPLAYSTPTFEKKEAVLHLIKEAQINRRALDDAKDKSYRVLESLQKLAADVKTDTYAAEALSCSSKDVAQFTKLASLVWGSEHPQYLDFADSLSLPKRSLTKAAKLRAELEMASELVGEIKTRTELNKRASTLEASFKKEAGLEKDASFLGTAAGVAKSLGSKAFNFTNKAVDVAGKAISGTKRTLSSPTEFGKTTGSAIGSVVAAPFKMVGRGIKSGAGAAINTGATKIQNLAASTERGKQLGIPHVSVKPSTIATKAKAGTALAVTGAAMDAGFYRPKQIENNPASGDVWEALNG